MTYSYTCKHTYSADDDLPGETSSWKCTLKIVRQTEDMTELEIRGRGSSFDVVIGSYDNGRFLCIPDMDTGCPITDSLFWNTERITRVLGNETDAVSVAFGIKAFEQIAQGIVPEQKHLRY